jgi:hypothetical protein
VRHGSPKWLARVSTVPYSRVDMTQEVAKCAQGQLAKHEFEKRDKDSVIKDLTEKLEALALLKKEHEDLLLVKFKELLNTKKAKIRELGRQLEQANARNGADEGTITPSLVT